jgi:cysteine synthase
MKTELVSEGGRNGMNNQTEKADSGSLPHLFPTSEYSSAFSSEIPGQIPIGSSQTNSRHPFQIGRTPVLSLPEISDYFGLKHLAIKDESVNQFGTHKDRKSLHVVLDTLKTASPSQDQALCILTAGNAGLSLANIAGHYGVSVTAFVGGESISPALLVQLKSVCAAIVPLDLEERLWPSDELCRLAGNCQGREVRDVTNGVIEPFETIMDEICELGNNQLPDVIVLPVGGGELFLGLAQGLKKRGLRTRLIGVTVRKDSAADKLYTKWNPYDGYIKKLTNSGSPHCLRGLDDERLLLDTFKWLHQLRAFGCEPSSAAAFAMLHKINDELRPNEKILVINTGTYRSRP